VKWPGLEAVRDNLKFSLESWPEAGLKVDFVLVPSVISPYLEAAVTEDGEFSEADPPQLASSMRGHLELQLFGKRLRLVGAFSVKVEFNCHRCLAAFVDRLGDNIAETVELVRDDREPDDESGAAVRIINNEFDLTPLICEFFWLAWPMKVLCRPDCAGLCLTCGANLNEGPCSCHKTQIVRH
jgi:uncharacterized protein